MDDDKYALVPFDAIEAETDRAVLYKIDDAMSLWVPKSVIRESSAGVVEIAEWFAIDRGLV